MVASFRQLQHANAIKSLSVILTSHTKVAVFVRNVMTRNVGNESDLRVQNDAFMASTTRKPRPAIPTDLIMVAGFVNLATTSCPKCKNIIKNIVKKTHNETVSSTTMDCLSKNIMQWSPNKMAYALSVVSLPEEK